MTYKKLISRLTIILFIPILLMFIITPVQDSYSSVSMNGTTIGTIGSTIVTQTPLTFDSLAIAGDGFTTRLTSSDELRKYTFDRTSSSVSYEVLWTDFLANLVQFKVNEPISDGRVTVSGTVIDNIKTDAQDHLKTNLVNFANAIIIKIIFTFIPPTPSVGDPTPLDPDSDNDGIIDSVDQCPLVFGTVENNGCPALVIEEPLEELQLPLLDFTIPFEFNELDIVDDYIILETELPQPQVEDLTIRWLSDEPITITSISIGNSPFEIVVENIPVTFGSESFGFTQTQLIYTVQEPDKICGDVINLDCLDEVTYQIPVIVSGVVNGKTIIADGSITIDNSGRTNPYWIALFGLLAVPVIALVFWRRRKAKPKTKTLFKVTQASTQMKPVPKAESLKSGTTKKLMKVVPASIKKIVVPKEKPLKAGTTKKLMKVVPASIKKIAVPKEKPLKAGTTTKLLKTKPASIKK